MIIKAYNYQTNGAPYTYLSVPTNAGGTALPVKNISQFYPSWAVQVGKTNEEVAEIKMLGTAAITGTVLNTTGTITYDHPTDTPIYAIKYDQLIFKRSTAGTAGTATALTDGTVSIKPDELFTLIDDPTGALTYAYKAAYRNSVTGEVSSDSDWLTPSGYPFFSKIAMRERIKNKLFNANYIKSDAVVDEWINEWYESMNNDAVKVNKEYNMGTVDVGFGTAGLGTITARDYKSIRRMWVTYNGVNFFECTNLPLTDIKPEQRYSPTEPKYANRGYTVFQVVPPNTGGTARIDYYRTSDILENDTDELPPPMRSYTKSFVDYGLSEAYDLDDKEGKAERRMRRAEVAKGEFIAEITPRDTAGYEPIQIDSALTADGSDIMYDI